MSRQALTKRPATGAVRMAWFVVGVVTAVTSAHADSWPQFRGPNGSGRPTVDVPLPHEIGPTKNLVWSTELPPGHSSPVVMANRIFLTGERGKHLVTLAVDRATGKLLWERDAGNDHLEEIHHIGSHAQASPAADNERVVCFFGSCGLLCYNHAGKLLWKVPLGPFKNNYGAASSPILVGNLVILNQDHDIDSFLLAVDKQTGKVVWKTDRSEFPRGFSTPIVWNNEGHDEIVVSGGLRVCAYEPDQGREQWTVHGSARTCSMTPVVGSDGTLFVTEWTPGGDENDRIVADPFDEIVARYDANKNHQLERDELPPGPLASRFDQIDRDKNGHITAVEYNWARNIFNSAQNGTLAIGPGARGNATSTHVRWRYAKNLPYIPSPVFDQGRLFLIKSGGIVSCVDAANGQLLKQRRAPGSHQYFSSPVIGDGMLLILDDAGIATFLTATPELKVISTTNFDEPAFATPALVDGRIYLRTNKRLHCFGQSH
ncbi:MAG TPA: PQQ-binding-like beta-propeller repeat protein [Planctomycetaceae bacterium]|nr:PQQ-binding-like beta-propeller repeat protein [Planctomycetaceae bacterium]